MGTGRGEGGGGGSQALLTARIAPTTEWASARIVGDRYSA